MSLASVKAITFDFTGTLAYPYPSVGKIYAQVLNLYGYEANHKALDQAFYEAIRSIPRPTPLSDITFRAYMELVVKRTVGPDIANHAGFPQVFDKLWDAFAHSKNWKLVPHVREVLQFLNVHGYRTVLLSNWDSRLRKLSQNLGLGHLFQKIILSTEEGLEKPDPCFFQRAQEMIGLNADQILHVGDHLHEDYEAAKRAGWQAVLVSKNADTAGGTHSIRYLSEIMLILTKAKGASGQRLTREAQKLISQFKNVPHVHSRAWMRRSRPISELVDTLLNKHSVEKESLETVITNHWQEVIGPKNASRSAPVKILYGKKIVVKTDSPTIRQEITFSRVDIIKRIQKLPGCSKIQDIILRSS